MLNGGQKRCFPAERYPRRDCVCRNESSQGGVDLEARSDGKAHPRTDVKGVASSSDQQVRRWPVTQVG